MSPGLSTLNTVQRQDYASVSPSLCTAVRAAREMNIIAYWSQKLCSINLLHFARDANDIWIKSLREHRGNTMSVLPWFFIIHLLQFSSLPRQIEHIQINYAGNASKYITAVLISPAQYSNSTEEYTRLVYWGLGFCQRHRGCCYFIQSIAIPKNHNIPKSLTPIREHANGQSASDID